MVSNKQSDAMRNQKRSDENESNATATLYGCAKKIMVDAHMRANPNAHVKMSSHRSEGLLGINHAENGCQMTT